MKSQTQKDILIGCAITLSLLIVSEVGLRIFWRLKWRTHASVYFTDEAGWKHEKGYYNSKSAAVGFYGNVNSLGYRDKEWSVEKSSNTTRIIVTGESLALGFYSYKENSDFPHQLENKINRKYRKSNYKVEVLNAGAPSNSSLQCEYRIKNELLKFHPDVLIVVIGCNDLGDENPKMLPTRIPNHWTRNLAQKSFLARAIFGVFYKILLPKIKPSQENLQQQLKELENFTPQHYANNLKDMIKISRENNVRIVLATLLTIVNMPEYSDSDFKGVTIDLYGSDIRLFRLLMKRYNETIRKVAKEENCSLSDMDEIFRKIPHSPKLFFDSFHLNEHGNEIYAEKLLEQLEQMKILGASK